MIRDFSARALVQQEAAVDAVGAFIDGEAQGCADLSICRDNYPPPSFLQQRLRLLFETTDQNYQAGYCRALQKYLEQGRR